MGWIIFGVIALCITLFFWKNSYTNYEWVYRDEEVVQFGRKYTRQIRDKKVYSDKLKMPLWCLLCLVVGYLIPIVNVILLLAIAGGFVYQYCDDELYISFGENTIMSKIIKFFNKDVF